tara:strand:- start:1381 stop:1563 length:183 start_codon:yes stop_codon:yes gene_type:complete
MNDKMRILVGKLDNTHKKLVSEVTKKGGLNLKTAQLGREYKDIQRDMIIVDNTHNKEIHK